MTWERLGNRLAHFEDFRCTECGRKEGLSHYSDRWAEAGEPELCPCRVEVPA